MKRKRAATIIAISALFAGALFSVLVAGFSRKEPRYQGRDLSAWLKELDDWEGSPNDPAAVALRAIGPRAVPELLRLLQAKDGRWRNWVTSLDTRQSIIRFSSLFGVDRETADTKQRWAFTAFFVLGSQGEAAIPELSRMRYDPRTSKVALGALAGIGPHNIPLILEAATNSNARVRSSALFALCFLHAEARPALPALIHGLQDPDYYARSCAAWTLGEFGANAHEIILPPLIEVLNDPHPNVRSKSVEALGKLGESSDAVLSALRTRQKDSDTTVKFLASKVLKELVRGSQSTE